MLYLADPTRLSSIAVIYLKNRTSRGWSKTDHYPDEPLIPEDEKERFRDRILPILASSHGPARMQLLQMIQRILHFDFPGKWPNFMDVTLRLLHANDPPSVLAGLQCLLVTCRAFRFKGAQDNGRAEFDKVVEASFPRLLQICNELVNQESDEAGEMLHIALKAYKHATWVRFYTRSRYRPLSFLLNLPPNGFPLLSSSSRASYANTRSTLAGAPSF